MNVFQALALGIVQGLTEFLPISSSGHLIIFPQIFNWEQQPLFFDTTLHLGTALAVIVYFFKDLKKLTLSLISCLSKNQLNLKNYDHDGLTAISLLLGTIPAAVIGFLFEDIFETVFRDTVSVIEFLLLGSMLMVIAEIQYKRVKKAEYLSLGKGIIIGFFQCLALFPGFSRSGSTISGGMITGMNRETAARFSFLMSVPIILGAGIYQLIGNVSDFTIGNLGMILIGFLSSFLSGIVAFRILMSILKSRSLYPFIFYRVALAVLLIILL